MTILLAFIFIFIILLSIFFCGFVTGVWYRTKTIEKEDLETLEMLRGVKEYGRVKTVSVLWK